MSEILNATDPKDLQGKLQSMMSALTTARSPELLAMQVAASAVRRVDTMVRPDEPKPYVIIDGPDALSRLAVFFLGVTGGMHSQEVTMHEAAVYLEFLKTLRETPRQGMGAAELDALLSRDHVLRALEVAASWSRPAFFCLPYHCSEGDVVYLPGPHCVAVSAAWEENEESQSHRCLREVGRSMRLALTKEQNGVPPSFGRILVEHLGWQNYESLSQIEQASTFDRFYADAVSKAPEGKDRALLAQYFNLLVDWALRKVDVLQDEKYDLPFNEDVQDALARAKATGKPDPLPPWNAFAAAQDRIQRKLDLQLRLIQAASHKYFADDDPGWT